ncbi:MAG TPA: DUF434 domain-containing protein [Polyangiaceae bacterium]|nr:DUF434 domain-containing protein [Polyangiaceae bacterium]
MATRPDDDALATIRSAAEDVAWLLGRDYPADAVSAFVAEHRQLGAAERHLLAANARMVARVRHHIAREMDPEDVVRRPLRVDAMNVLAVVAAAREGKLLLESPAGLLTDPDYSRDQPLPDDEALAEVARLCCAALEPLRPKAVQLLVAADREDSERTASALEAAIKATKLKGATVEHVGDVLEALANGAFVVSSDAAVLDRCATWMNLVPLALADVDHPPPLRLE